MKSLSAKVQKISKGLPKTVQAFIAKKKFNVEDDSAISEIKRGELFHLYTVGSKFYFADTEGDEYHIFQITQNLFMQLKYSHTETQYHPGRLGPLLAKFDAKRKQSQSLLKRTRKLRESVESDLAVTKLVNKQSEQIRLLSTHAIQLDFNKNLASLKRIMSQWNLHRQYRIRPLPHTYAFMEDFILVWNTLVELRDSGKKEEVPSYLDEQIKQLEEKWGIDFHGNPLQYLQERRTNSAPIHDINRLRPDRQGPNKPLPKPSKILEFKPKAKD